MLSNIYVIGTKKRLTEVNTSLTGIGQRQTFTGLFLYPKPKTDNII